MSNSYSRRVLYQDDNLCITMTLIEYNKAQYHIRDIYTMRRIEDKPDPEPLKKIILFGGLLILISLLLYCYHCIHFDFFISIFILGLILIVIGVNELNNLKSNHTLIVTTKKWDEITIKSTDTDKINTIQSAIEEAIHRLAYGAG